MSRWEPHIHNDHIRMMFNCFCYGFLRAVRLVHDLKLGVAREKGADAEPNDLVVVNKENFEHI